MVTNNFFNTKSYRLITLFIVLMPGFALAMFTIKNAPKQSFISTKKPSSRSFIKNIIEKQDNFTPFVSEKLLREKVDELVQTKEIDLKENQFYVFSTQAKEGAIVDGDTLHLSQVMKNMIGDIADESTRKLNFSERQIQLSADYSGEIIKVGFDLLKKYKEKPSILDDVAALDLKKFTEIVNFCHYLDLTGTDMYTILSNELIKRIKKTDGSTSSVDSNQLNIVNKDFLKTFVFPKAVWDVKLTAVYTNHLEINTTIPIKGFNINSFSIYDRNIVNNIRSADDWDYYTWIFEKNNQWFLQFFFVPNQRASVPFWQYFHEPWVFHNINNNNGEVIQLRCNWDKKRAVSAIKGSGNNGIVLDFNNIKNMFGFALPECAQDINSITINADANIVVAAFNSDENNLIIWDISGGRDNITVEKETRKTPVSSVMLKKNGTGSDMLMYCSEKTIYSKNIQTNQWREFASFDSPIKRAEMSPDEKSIAVIFDSDIILVNAENGKSLCKKPKDELDCSILFSPDNTYFAKAQSNLAKAQSKYGRELGDTKFIHNTFFMGYGCGGYPDASALIIVTPFNGAAKLLPQDLTMSRLIYIYNWFEKGIFSKSFDYFKRMGSKVAEIFNAYMGTLQ